MANLDRQKHFPALPNNLGRQITPLFNVRVPAVETSIASDNNNLFTRMVFLNCPMQALPKCIYSIITYVL